MIDVQMRRVVDGPITGLARAVDVHWISPNRLTLIGLVIGLASAGFAATQLWIPALIAWLISRVFDGLDGALARRRRAGAEPSSEVGGFLDIMADFIVYGAGVMGVAIGATAAFDAPWWPFLLVLLAYYLNGTAFLAFSSIAERTGRRIEDGRSLSFLGRIAEGTETIAVHAIWLLIPAHAWQIAVGWAILVFISAAQRIVSAVRILR
ncbi:CDP-alcohol phosphatidyltransferase family protein [Microbacterium sp. NPDC076768]|uniref:CDP-alcohol phosphatidyltransferase family protein n=1 Tax=Microbacterium sp. NPDC076768 TaxID=3154858 RepID=UPI00343EE819